MAVGDAARTLAGAGRAASLDLDAPAKRPMGMILEEQEGMLEGILDRLLDMRARVDGTNSVGATSKSDRDTCTAAPSHAERLGRISGLIERIEHAVSGVISFV